MQERQVRSLGQEYPLEKGMASPKITPGFLPGKSHGQRSLLGYSPWSCKELDTAEGLKNNNAYSVCVCVCVFARTRVCVLPMCQNHARPWGFRDDSGRALSSWSLKWRHIRDGLAQSFCV